MDSYVSVVSLIVNGEEITDFSAVEEKARTLRKQVNLMKKTGVLGVTQRYGVSVDYVVPKDKPEFDFAGIEDGTLTIDKENGRRRHPGHRRHKIRRRQGSDPHHRLRRHRSGGGVSHGS